MNCKPGDLAIMIGGPKNAGKVVQCERLARLGERIESECGESDLVITHLGRHATWLVDRPVAWADGHEYRAAKDVVLRPLRDSDGQDEMLRIADLPKQEQPTTH